VSIVLSSGLPQPSFPCDTIIAAIIPPTSHGGHFDKLAQGTGFWGIHAIYLCSQPKMTMNQSEHAQSVLNLANILGNETALRNVVISVAAINPKAFNLACVYCNDLKEFNPMVKHQLDDLFYKNGSNIRNCKIALIKLHRQLTGAGLRESKEYIEKHYDDQY
jgi:hypothetical protein